MRENSNFIGCNVSMSPGRQTGDLATGDLVTSLYKGQVLLEYIVVIMAVIAALLTMQIYIKRAVQGRYKDAADATGGIWYNPKNAIASSLTTTTTTRTQTTRVENSIIIGARVTVTDSAYDTNTIQTGTVSIGVR